MLEPQAPHEQIHSSRSFVIHIAAITVGLLLAFALEQSAEAIHHHHQRTDLETIPRVELSQAATAKSRSTPKVEIFP